MSAANQSTVVGYRAHHLARAILKHARERDAFMELARGYEYSETRRLAVRQARLNNWYIVRDLKLLAL